MCLEDSLENNTNFRDDAHTWLVRAQLGYIPIIVITNLLILVSTHYVKQLHTPDNLLLAGLATVDMSIGVVVIPLTVMKGNPNTDIWDNSEFLCIFWHMTSTSLFMSSLTMLTLIVIFKSVSINFPFWYMQNVGNKEAVRSCVVAVVLNFSLYGPINAQAFNTDDNGVNNCSQLNITHWFSHWFITSGIYFIMVFQLSLSSILCIQITVTAWRMSEKREVKANLVICLLFLFIILWLPTLFQMELISGEWGYRQCERLVFLARQFRLFESFVNALAYGSLHSIHRYAYGFLLTRPPWKWREVGDYMRERKKKEVMKQYVAALRYKVKSIAVSQKRMKELMKEEILSEQTLQDNENVTPGLSGNQQPGESRDVCTPPPAPFSRYGLREQSPKSTRFASFSNDDKSHDSLDMDHMATSQTGLDRDKPSRYNMRMSLHND